MNQATLRHRDHERKSSPGRLTPDDANHSNNNHHESDKMVINVDPNYSREMNEDENESASPIRDSSSKSGSAGSASVVAGFAAESSLPLAQSALIAFLYTTGSTIFFLLIRYSKKLEKDGLLKYDNAAAVFFIELVKWTFSVSAMYYRTGKFLPVSVFKEGSWKIGIYYAVPSGIYFIYNNFTFFNLNIFDPATYQVFMQTRVLFTGVLYSVIFHKHLSRQKWLALVLLTIGVASKYMGSALSIDSRVLFMLFQASLSAFAGVYNEFLLKKDISMDVNEQNFFMYSFALVFNLGFGMFMNPDYYTSGKVFSNVSHSTFFFIVLTGALMGISASLVLKFINVIVKAFASATEVLITAVLAAMFLGEVLTGKDLVACCIVMAAIYLYYHQASTPAVVVNSSSGGNASTSSGNTSGQSSNVASPSNGSGNTSFSNHVENKEKV